jgi:hypothetical protein
MGVLCLVTWCMAIFLTLWKFLIFYCCCFPFSVSCVLFVWKCVLLLLGVNPIAVKYISYHTVPYHTSYHIIHTSYHTIYHTISYHTISYHIISYHTISYDIISYHIISYHISYNHKLNSQIIENDKWHFPTKISVADLYTYQHTHEQNCSKTGFRKLSSFSSLMDATDICVKPQPTWLTLSPTH